jgi:hypothetical protein
MTRRTKLGTAMTIVLALAAPAWPEDLRDRVERLERELLELKAEMKRRDAERSRPAPAPAPTAAAPAPTPAPVETAKVPAETETAKGIIPAALLERVKLGAYGSVRYEGSNIDDQNHTFTFRRFVLTTDADIHPRLRAYAELEFERFRKLEIEKATVAESGGGLEVEQTVEGTADSEIALEQAWLEFDLWEKYVRARAGGLLVPLGRFNINHDDNRWDLPRRSLVDRGAPVLPTTAAWDELGAGLVGDVPVGSQGMINYQGFVVNGVALDTEFEQIVTTRQRDTTLNVVEAKIEPSTGTFASDVKDAKAGTGRVAWSPWLGHEIGLSGYYGQYTPDFLGNESLWAGAVDGRTGWGPFELEGQWVYTRFGGVKDVAKRFAQTALQHESEAETGNVETEIEFELAGLARIKHGYWLEGRYRFWPTWLNETVLGRAFANPQLVAVARAEQAKFDDLIEEVGFTNGILTEFDSENRFVNRFTGGLAYRPVPLVVFQLAYEYTVTNDGKSLAGVTNYIPAGPTEDHAHTILVGAAFGF